MVKTSHKVLRAYPRGFHIITDIVEAEVRESGIRQGICHVFIQHTSASLTINENADPSVRADFESHFTRNVSEDLSLYLHNMEGRDDMPAHIKASLLGSSVSVPIENGKLQLGTWQGIYLGEHRNHGGSRKIVITILGE